MTDDGNLPAVRALPGQPVGVILAGVASIAGTWDKNDHGCEGNAPESLPGQGTRFRGSAFAPKYENLR
jgi:hypothetical protein